MAEPASTPQALLAGRYEVQAELGRGGMARRSTTPTSSPSSSPAMPGGFSSTSCRTWPAAPSGAS